MSDLITDGMIYLLARPARVAACLVGVTVLGAVVDVLLREKCRDCGERLRIPLEGHWLLQHAGDPT